MGISVSRAHGQQDPAAPNFRERRETREMRVELKTTIKIKKTVTAHSSLLYSSSQSIRSGIGS